MLRFRDPLSEEVVRKDLETRRMRDTPRAPAPLAARFARRERWRRPSFALSLLAVLRSRCWAMEVGRGFDLTEAIDGLGRKRSPSLRCAFLLSSLPWRANSNRQYSLEMSRERGSIDAAQSDVHPLHRPGTKRFWVQLHHVRVRRVSSCNLSFRLSSFSSPSPSL